MREKGVRHAIDLSFRQEAAAGAVHKPLEHRRGKNGNSARPIRELLPSRAVDREPERRERSQHVVPIAIAEWADLDGCRVEDLPEVRGSRFLGPAEVPQRTAATCDQPEALLLAE